MTPFRRRRPLYVGAGYSTARRRKQNGSPAGSFRSEEDALRSSHSESMLSSRTMDEAMTSTADGKRRRIDDEMDRPSDLAVGNLSRSLSMGASPKSSIFAATSSGIASYSKDQQHPLSSIPLNNLLSQPQVTPVRHSPLWQVSQAGKRAFIWLQSALCNIRLTDTTVRHICLQISQHPALHRPGNLLLLRLPRRQLVLPIS